MKTNKLYDLLSNLNSCIDLLGAEIRTDKGALSKNLSEASDHIGSAFACVEGELPVPATLTKRDGLLSESFEDQLELAFEILKDETKPGATLIQKKLEVTQALSRKLFKSLVDSGRIIKGKRATSKRSHIMRLINELPIGDDLLVSKHLHPLLNLRNAKHRALYLCGIELKDQFDANDIARATAAGVNRTLVDEIVQLQKTKPRKVKPDDIIKAASAKKGGDERAQAYHKLRVSCIGAIDKGMGSKVGADLYRHMTKQGLTTQVLADFKMIATAYSKGRA